MIKCQMAHGRSLSQHHLLEPAVNSEQALGSLPLLPEGGPQRLWRAVTQGLHFSHQWLH